MPVFGPTRRAARDRSAHGDGEPAVADAQDVAAGTDRSPRMQMPGAAGGVDAAATHEPRVACLHLAADAAVWAHGAGDAAGAPARAARTACPVVTPPTRRTPPTGRAGPARG